MTGLDERGGALLAALALLSAMTLLATMSLMAGGSDLTIARRRARERGAFYAAESALAVALQELASSDGLIAEASFSAPWPDPLVPRREWTDGPWSCARRIRPLADVADADGDPSTTVVLFDRSFGRADAPAPSGGHPVFQLLVEARCGESRQAIVAEVTPVALAPTLAAAWTAAGPLTLRGDLRVAGAAGLGAVAGVEPARPLDGAVVDGANAEEPLASPPGDVLALLNPGGTLPRLDDLPPPSGAPLRGVFWSRVDYAGALDGQGTIVVHNPAFDPAKHEASRLALEHGVFVEGYDPAYSHLDPARQPARLDVAVGGSFRGLVVADVIGGCAAPLTVTGALVTLSRSPLSVTAAAPLRILGSREALAAAGRGPLRHLTGFRPLSGETVWTGP